LFFVFLFRRSNGSCVASSSVRSYSEQRRASLVGNTT
jgi:hypothetical protein